MRTRESGSEQPYVGLGLWWPEGYWDACEQSVAAMCWHFLWVPRERCDRAKADRKKHVLSCAFDHPKATRRLQIRVEQPCLVPWLWMIDLRAAKAERQHMFVRRIVSCLSPERRAQQLCVVFCHWALEV